MGSTGPIAALDFGRARPDGGRVAFPAAERVFVTLSPRVALGRGDRHRGRGLESTEARR